jgi:hypothetical protein
MTPDGRTDISLGIQYRVFRSAKHAPRDRTLSDNSAPRSVTQWSTPLRGVEQKMPEIQLFNDINELPELKEFDNDDKDQEKLIVFDDFINLKKPERRLMSI